MELGLIEADCTDSWKSLRGISRHPSSSIKTFGKVSWGTRTVRGPGANDHSCGRGWRCCSSNHRGRGGSCTARLSRAALCPLVEVILVYITTITDANTR